MANAAAAGLAAMRSPASMPQVMIEVWLAADLAAKHEDIMCATTSLKALLKMIAFVETSIGQKAQGASKRSSEDQSEKLGQEFQDQSNRSS